MTRTDAAGAGPQEAPAEPPPRRRARRRRVTLARRDARAGLLLITPTLVIVLAVVLVPLAWSLLIAFQRIRLINVGRTGLFENLTVANFARVLGSDALWDSLLVTVTYTAGSTVLAIVVGWSPRWRCAGRSPGGGSCGR